MMKLSELEAILAELRDRAERYRQQREALALMEERWLKFVELALVFGVELKPAEGAEFYAGGPLPDNSDMVRQLDRALANVRKLKEVYGDLIVMVDAEVNIRKILIKI